MRFIRLSSSENGKPIFVNIETIGHIYTITNTDYDKTVSTVVGTTCHRNGGFRVNETPEKIFNLIEKSKHS